MKYTNFPLHFPITVIKYGLSEKTVRWSAVQPHGVKSRPRNEDDERARGKGKHCMEMNTKRSKESPR
jgi:hypothetical protein